MISQYVMTLEVAHKILALLITFFMLLLVLHAVGEVDRLKKWRRRK